MLKYKHEHLKSITLLGPQETLSSGSEGLMEQHRIQLLMVTHLRQSGLGVGEVGIGCASDLNYREGISANHSPNTERRAEATASRAANVTSPACWG